MRRLALISCLLVTAVTSQTDQEAERPLPQWLTGIIALCLFLFLTFITLVVKKAWCDESNRTNPPATSLVVVDDVNTAGSALEMVRSKEEQHAYDNLVTNDDDLRVTPM
ncbi:PDZK1-interacting protein 1 [Antennarius striatus]|uniref:PDZK1-interacting protein 1 n=1 Tax=Antennarius striatus TaxID=241820 RepID=UPI0035B4B1B9